MNNDLDALLAAGLVQVPEDFSERVMREINCLPLPVPKQAWRDKLQWLAIAGTAVLGVVELFSFVFGIWNATTAY